MADERPLTIDRETVPAFPKQHKAEVSDNPQEERVLPDLVAADPAKKQGSSYVEEPAIPEIDGWLGLFAFALIIGPFFTAYSIIQNFTLISTGQTTDLQSVLKIETALLSILVLFHVYVAVAFFRRNKAAPNLVITLLIARVAFYVIDMLVIESVLKKSAEVDDLLRSLIGAGIWIPYFLLSKRVKATFVFGGATGNGVVLTSINDTPSGTVCVPPTWPPLPKTDSRGVGPDPGKEVRSKVDQYITSQPSGASLLAGQGPPLLERPAPNKGKLRWGRSLWVAIPIAVLVCLLGWYWQGSSRSRSPDAIFLRVSPAVVQVVIQDREGATLGTGSGFLISSKGLIATNYHVIEKAHSAHVVLADKTELSVLGVAALDEEADIAIIKVVGQISAPPLELAGNDLPPVGAKVYAIGNPLGLANTLSDGLVSGHRGDEKITLIQTTAPISPGSSGGPLLSADGKVVGVTTLFGKVGQNLNFAVPASHVARLLLRCEGEGQLTQFPLVRQTEAIAYIKRGMAWFEKNDYEQAIKEFNEAIRLDPKYALAYWNRGKAWLAKSDYDQAILDYGRAIQLDPTDASAYESRGYAWFCKEDYDEAIKDYNEAIRLDSQTTYFYRGSAWLRKKDYNKAIKDYNEAIRLDSQNSFFITSRGNVWSRMKDYDKAIKDYDQSIRLYPKDASVYTSRGDAWFACHYYDNAIKDYDQAIRLDPKYARAYNNRGDAWFAKQEYSNAIRDYDQAIRLDPKIEPAYTSRRAAWSLKKGR